VFDQRRCARRSSRVSSVLSWQLAQRGRRSVSERAHLHVVTVLWEFLVMSVVRCARRRSVTGGCWLNSKNEDSTSLRNVGNRLPMDTASHPS
jgi:hypothetical protein